MTATFAAFWRRKPAGTTTCTRSEARAEAAAQDDAGRLFCFALQSPKGGGK
jgi:hypothetical protein